MGVLWQVASLKESVPFIWLIRWMGAEPFATSLSYNSIAHGFQSDVPHIVSDTRTLAGSSLFPDDSSSCLEASGCFWSFQRSSWRCGGSSLSNFLLLIHPGEIPGGQKYRSCMGGATSQGQEAALPAGLVPRRQALAGPGLEE